MSTLKTGKAWLLSIASFIFILGSSAFAQPGDGGRLVVATSPDWPSLDPQSQGATTLAYVHIFDALVTLNQTFDELVPQLATGWEMLDDTTWQFTLRQGVSFHNGEPFNAEAVKFTVDRVKDQPAGSYFAMIVGAEVVDEFIVNISTDGPYPGLIGRLTGLAIIPPGYISEVGDDEFANVPVGTGPFRFVSWVRDSRTVLERNENYWGELARAAEMEVRIIPDSTAAVSALLADEVDIVFPIDPLLEPTIVSAGHRVVSQPALRLIYALLRGDQGGPLADHRVRQAINYAVDRETIIETVYSGRADVIATFTFPGVVGHDPEATPYPYDPDRARQLLAEAGFPDGEGMPTLELCTSENRFLFDRVSAEAISQYLSEAGIKNEVQILEWGVFLERFLNHDICDIFLGGVHNIPLDADQAFTRFVTTGTQNYWNDDPEVDELILAAAREMNPARRDELYSEVNAVLKEEAGLLFLYRLHDVFAAHQRVNGFDVAVPADYPRLTHVWIEN